LWNSFWKCSYANGTIEEGLTMCMSSTTHGNRQEGKQLTINCKALKWARANDTLFKGSPSRVPMANGMTVTSPSRLWWL
jgi:hypothetical protein